MSKRCLTSAALLAALTAMGCGGLHKDRRANFAGGSPCCDGAVPVGGAATLPPTPVPASSGYLTPVPAASYGPASSAYGPAGVYGHH